MTKPTVLIPCDVKMLGEYPFHSVGEKYISAVAHSAGAMPLLLPAWGASKEMSSLTGHYDIPSLLDRIDGVLLPGSYSNVHPRWYRGDDVDMELDEQRDETVFTLIDEVLARDLPLFAICRGFQELNVSLGGDLQPRLHEQGGAVDHREDDTLPFDQRYESAHDVTVEPGGLLESIVQSQTIAVNSLHSQGVSTLADSLRVEALAADGLVEAVSLPGKWVLGVQWHPEWRSLQDPVSTRLFAAFGAAMKHLSARKWSGEK